jgi:hypothetical protein
MKKPEDFPTDERASFTPTKIFYIRAPKNFSGDVTTHDVTSLTTDTYDGLSGSYIDTVKALSHGLLAETADYTFKRKSFLHTHTHVFSTTGLRVAEISAPVFAFGARTFVFPKSSAHSSHAIEMKPVGVARRAESFVKDSVLYFWDTEGMKVVDRVLVKVVGGKKVPVARYGSRHAWDGSGVLVVDGREVDEAVAVVSCVALLELRDSFSK